MAELNLSSLKSLTIFKTLYETGSATKAAKALGVTQSGVSRSLGVLEENLGLSLFIRDKNRLVAKPEAEELYNAILKLMFNLDELKHSILALREFGVSRIRVAAIPGLAFGFVPRIVARMLAMNPKLNVYFDIMSTSEVVRSVEAGQFDIGFVTMPITSEQLHLERIAKTEAVCIVPKGHPLAKKKAVDIEDLRRQHLIVANQPNIAADQVLKLIDDHQIALSGKTEANIGSICALVENGVGVSIMNPITAADSVGSGTVTLPFTPKIHYSFAMVYQKKWRGNQAVQLIRDILKDTTST
ncbi:LysR family transcriptional regulator [Kordiimonas marina]|uniref:LysR family transcriptional regulator n=1 Tax=Kordiimonas marina TaxID=2872312 RepID=UPI001FF40F5D|nr:LysR family transcriptional regulator [Kordiimonas marina]MCJ9430075.1 LysR family transcriptional regulator [Kordiimonas marina]